jgi:hypothetical protein
LEYELTVPATPVPLNETLGWRRTRAVVGEDARRIAADRAVVHGCAGAGLPDVETEGAAREHELLTIAFAPPLTVNAATAALCTRTLVSAASIWFTPPAA